jgi:hypothetical protein
MESKDVFLSNIKKKIDEGGFDKEFTIPFMTRKLMYAAIKGKIQKLLDTGGTPMLSDAEVKTVLEEMKEASGSAFYLFVTYGILEETKSGYQLTAKGARAIRESFKL